MKTMEIARKIGGVAHLKTANSGTPSKAPVLMPEKYSKSDVENAGASGDMYENTGSHENMTDYKAAFCPTQSGALSISTR